MKNSEVAKELRALSARVDKLTRTNLDAIMLQFFAVVLVVGLAGNAAGWW